MRWYNKVIDAIVYITFTLLAILLIVFIIQIVNALYFNEAELFFNETIVDNAIFYLLSFFVAVVTLKKTIDIQTIDSLSKLRGLLNSDEKKKIHQELITETDPANELSVEQLDYIGIIELGAIMYRKGVIGDEELYNQFGYRVENIVKSSLYEKLQRDKSYYDDFFYIEKIINKISSKKHS